MRPTAVEVAVRRALRAEGPWRGRTVVCALSGGPDSTALLDALAACAPAEGFTLAAAHLDHGLRPESAADASFCVELCRRLGVDLHVGRADVASRARRQRGGLEQAARRERYAFLRAVLKQTGAAAVAVAHTRDDQAETVLLRLLRGAGRRGLGAMRPRRGAILRPLLSLSREQVMAHLGRRRLCWLEDATNQDRRLLRNRVRHELLPYLESRFNPRLRGAMARMAAVMADESELLDQLAADLLARVGRMQDGGMVLARAGLSASPPALARLALRAALRRTGGLRGVQGVHVERLLGLCAVPGASGRRLPLPGGRQACVRFGELWIGAAAPAGASFQLKLEVPGEVQLPDGSRLSVREERTQPGSQSAEAVVSLPAGPLVVRTRRPGDRFWTGRRERSLKRVLMESRVPADLRAGLPLVAAGDRVVWFPGLDGRLASHGGGRAVALALRPAPAEAVGSRRRPA